MRLSFLAACKPLLAFAFLAAVLAVTASAAAQPIQPTTVTGWVWPTSPPRVARDFAPPPLPWLPGHRGLDLETAVGNSVGAAGSGVVRFAGVVAGRGVVSISHGSLITTYEPVAALVGRGDVVAAGTVIGTVEDRGSHCAPSACLHFGLRRGSSYLDPRLLFADLRVRLLPLEAAAGGRRR